MKDLGFKQNKLAIRLRNNQREINRLMEEYETLDAVVVSGSDIKDMDEWLVQPRRKRRAAEIMSEGMANTQTTESSDPTQRSAGESNVSDAASDCLAHGEFSDDFTGEDEDDEDEKQSVDTRTGMPDSQLTDASYDEQIEKKKRKKKKKKHPRRGVDELLLTRLRTNLPKPVTQPLQFPHHLFFSCPMQHIRRNSRDYPFLL